MTGFLGHADEISSQWTMKYNYYTYSYDTLLVPIYYSGTFEIIIIMIRIPSLVDNQQTTPCPS